MKKKALGEQTFTQGAAVLLLSTVLVKLISAFFKIPLSADYCLGNLGFGYFTSVYDIYIPIYTLAVSGFPVAISKIVSFYLAKGEEEQARVIVKVFKRIMLLLGIVGFLSLLIITKPFVSLTDSTGRAAYIMFSMAPAVIFCCLSSVYRGAFEGFGNMNPTAMSSVIEALSKVALGFTAAFITVRLTGSAAFGAAAAMVGITIGTCLSFIFLKISYKRHEKSLSAVNNGDINIKSGLLKELIIISLPIVFASFAGSVVSLIDAITVKWQLSFMMKDSFAEITESLKNMISLELESETLPTLLYGVRSKAYTLFYLAPTFTSALGIGALPVITKAFSKGDKESANGSIASLIKFSSVLAFPMAFGFIFVGTPIMDLLYGDGVTILGGKMLALYGLSAATGGISMALTTALQGIDKQNTVFINFSVGLVLKVIFNILLVGIPSLNILGSVISTVVCYLYIFVANLCSLKNSGFLKDIKNTFLKPFLSAIACGVTAFSVSQISDSKVVTLLAILAAAVVYFVLLVAFKTFKSEDFSGLPFENKLKKLLNIPE